MAWEGARVLGEGPLRQAHERVWEARLRFGEGRRGSGNHEGRPYDRVAGG